MSIVYFKKSVIILDNSIQLKMNRHDIMYYVEICKREVPPWNSTLSVMNSYKIANDRIEFQLESKFYSSWAVKNRFIYFFFIRI